MRPGMDAPSILIVKTSSLGDVVHNMPAITDLRRARPQATITWLVEEDYAPLAALHPAVTEVIPVAVRRWRRSLHRAETWREMRAFARDLRRRRYDLVVDTQGLSRSAVLARLARGARHGYDWQSIRERMAALFYQSRHRVGRDLHAIERNRKLVAHSVGYAPDGPPDYGLSGLASAGSPARAVLLHGSAQEGKEWPQAHWVVVGKALRERGFEVLLPWGTARERARSDAMAQEIGPAGVHVPDRTPLDRTARMLAESALVVGLDTGLVHLAAALGVPVVAIFAGSNPELTGPRGAGPIRTLGAGGAPPEPAAVIAAFAGWSPAQPA
jgi:heptosyltransferase I